MPVVEKPVVLQTQGVKQPEDSEEYQFIPGVELPGGGEENVFQPCTSSNRETAWKTRSGVTESIRPSRETSPL